MTNLVERYVHQVGRYVPPKERAEIEAELHSQIQDQLDDRFAGTPTQADIASVLAELGHPYQMATSYRSGQYLVGPELYPFMMMVLWRVLLIVPAIVVFLSVFGVLISSQPGTFTNLIIEPLIATIQPTFFLAGGAVVIFALIQHSHVHFGEEGAFNPLELPEVDDPSAVDRFQSAFGAVFGALFVVLLLYFAQVGGLTLHFDPTDPADVIPVPAYWLIAVSLIAAMMVVLNLLVLRRSHWGVWLLLFETVLEVSAAISMYFAVYEPILQRILATNPALADVPLIDSVPEILVVLFAVSTLVNNGSKLVRLWNYRNSSTPLFAVQTDG